jgi:Flp pilus assembly protein TadD
VTEPTWRSGAASQPSGAPAGDVYDWYVRGTELLASGNAAAAAALLLRASAADPGSRQLREALGRAQYDAGDYPAARSSFSRLVDADPADDYARFGLGLAAWRTGDVDLAVGSLTLAVAMRPDNRHYSLALRRVRATSRRP